MASSSYISNSPTVVMPAQHLPDQYFHDAHYSQVQSVTSNGITRGHTLSSSSIPPTPGERSIAGRKRSREDIYDDEQMISTGPASQEQLGCGPGKTHVYPTDLPGYVGQDRSEGRIDQDNNAANACPRPIMPTRKSQRLGTNSRTPDDIAAAVAQSSSRAPGAEPLIDEASRLLGISWTRLDLGENNQIKQRAFQRWIAHHYPFLSGVDLWFENTAIPGYLGKAFNSNNRIEEYYLWSLDLHQAILVTRQASDLIIKLSQPHMSLSQAVETIRADLEPVVEASAANAAILRNDRFLADREPASVPSGNMEID